MNNSNWTCYNKNRRKQMLQAEHLHENGCLPEGTGYTVLAPHLWGVSTSLVVLCYKNDGGGQEVKQASWKEAEHVHKATHVLEHGLTLAGKINDLSTVAKQKLLRVPQSCVLSLCNNSMRIWLSLLTPYSYDISAIKCTWTVMVMSLKWGRWPAMSGSFLFYGSLW